MEITIDLIKELREATYAPVGDCKKALELANGDISAAKDELKKLGKSTERTVIPEAGAISIRASDRCICIAVGRSETDFVSRNEQFIKFTDEAANEYYDRAGFNVQEIIDEWLGKANIFKEKCELDLSVATTLHKFAYYLHHNRQRCGWVEYTGDNHEAAIKIATHVVAMSPKVLGRDDMPAEDIKEIEDSLIAKLREEGKPEKSLEMIVKGQMKKKLSEFVLMDQPMYSDAKTSVEQFCADNGIVIHSYKSVTV